MTDKPIALEARGQDGARLFSPSAGRNKDIVSDWLAAHLPQDANVLEIASGTGEHGAAIGAKRSDIIWQYSDPDDKSRSSQAACAKPDWPSPLLIDVSREGWWADLPRYEAVFCANMIHIAPWDAALGLAAGASKVTDDVILYGPFLTGNTTAPSNLDFDRSLKRRNPAWGVRDLTLVKDMFAKLGFKHVQCFTMPRNNLIVRLSRH